MNNSSNKDINNNGYQSDPLARLDLTWGVFSNNTQNVFAGGDELNANNNSISPNRGTPDNNAGAFYNNSDADFKSRRNNKTGANPDGPFTSETRRRNAQRQALRVYPDMTVIAPTMTNDCATFGP